ncbi:hypothetical protein Droror1_Dr00027450 [Drosera rotundifolia]
MPTASFARRVGSVVQRAASSKQSTWYSPFRAAASWAVAEKIGMVDFVIEVRDARVLRYTHFVFWVFSLCVFVCAHVMFDEMFERRNGRFRKWCVRQKLVFLVSFLWNKNWKGLD